MSYQDPFVIQSIINRAKRIAIVGLSPNELRASYPDLELEVHQGGQPHYPLLLAAE